MIPRLRLDLGVSDLARAYAALASPRTEATARRRVERLFDAEERAVAGLSVRTLLDATLASLRLPAGSEVVMSPLTLADMARVVEAHGLIPVPADLDPTTAFPTDAGLRAACSPRTRALLVAHLFGGRGPMGPVLALARERGLLVLEDAAQAFAADGWRGSPGADFTFFSFGLIKTATALGGGLALVPDPVQRGALRACLGRQPVLPRRWFLARCLRATLLAALGLRPSYSLLARLAPDLDAVVGQAARGFPERDLLRQLRRRAPAPLWVFLAARLGRLDSRALERRSQQGRRLGAAYGADSHVGGAQGPHGHWVVPLWSAHPEQLVRRLRARGIDATRRSSLGAVAGHPGTVELLQRIVFVPHRTPPSFLEGLSE